MDQKSVEIQVRTTLQQAWAELSEKLSDLFDPALKYGGGEPDIKELLSKASVTVAEQEANESNIRQLLLNASTMLRDANLTEEARTNIINYQKDIASVKAEVAQSRESILKTLRRIVERLGGE